MYYINHSPLNRRTTKDERKLQRNFDRDTFMRKRLKIQHKKCFFCGTLVDMSGHLDHLHPIYYGGTSVTLNLVASCKSCNLTKGTDQIEITNEETIAFYINLKNEFSKWVGVKIKEGSCKPNKYVRQYWLYDAKLFTRTKHSRRLKHWESALL